MNRRHAKKFLPLLYLLALLVGCEFLRSPFNVGHGDGVLKCPDVLSLPGEKVTLAARFKSVTGDDEYESQRQQLLYGGAVVDEALTDDEGEASLRFLPPGADDYRPALRVADGEDHTASPITVCACVRPAGTRIIITDIDHTISDASGVNVVRSANDKLPPIDGAVRCLNALAGEYTIVYVTGREDFLAYKTRNWLDANGFPTGPVFLWNAFDDPFSRRSYKAGEIKRIKAVWPNVVAGVGDAESDGWAYYDADLPAIFIIGEERGEYHEYPKGTRFVERWDEILAALLPC